jgi:hypothetical protein
MLRITLEPVTKERAAPADAVVEATVVNTGGAPELFNADLAQRGSLVLHVEDESGRRVLLPPPSAPTEYDYSQGRPLAPGASLTIRYMGFLGAGREPGRYRVRYYSSHGPLGGSLETPLASDWIVLDLPGRPGDVFTPGPFVSLVVELWRAVRKIWVGLVGSILRLMCFAVLEKEVDVYVVETISNATPAAWNGMYAWNARFHVRVHQPEQYIFITIFIRLVGAQGSDTFHWVGAIEGAWSHRFKSCVDLGCSANGLPIRLTIRYVQSGEHQVVRVVPGRTLNMNEWSLSDTSDIRHEVGHMIGNKEEYFTIDGVDYGAPRQANGNIMNNPLNDPVPAHFWLMQQAVDQLLGINYSFHGGTVKRADRPCI